MEDKKTIDYVVRENKASPKTESFRYGKKLSCNDREKIVELYNNNQNIRVKDICSSLNQERDEDKKTEFSVSTLYNILKEYQQNGINIEWRQNKKRKKAKNELVKQENYLVPKTNEKIRTISALYKKPKQYVNKVIGKGIYKTKDFFKRNISTIAKYAAVSALSFAMGFMFGTNGVDKQGIAKPINDTKGNIEEKIDFNQENRKNNSYSILEAENTQFYFSLPEENKTISEFNKKICYTEEEYLEEKTENDYFLKKGDSLWEIMEKNNARPELWEFLYASNEKKGKTKNEILRQSKIKEFAEKHGFDFLKNNGKGKFEPYNLGSQYKIKDGLALKINQSFSSSMKTITPEIESEFNRIFYS